MGFFACLALAPRAALQLGSGSGRTAAGRSAAGTHRASASTTASATAVLSAPARRKTYTLAPATLKANSSRPAAPPAEPDCATTTQSQPAAPAPARAPRRCGLRGLVRQRVVVPDETSFYFVVGPREVQLAPDLVVGAKTFGNSQPVQLTLYFKDAQGRACSYGKWKEERASRSARSSDAFRQPLCSSEWSSDGSGGLEANRAKQSNTVRLSGNNMDMLGKSTGRRHALILYQRHPDQLGVGSFECELL